MGLCLDKAGFVLEVGGRPSVVGGRGGVEATDFFAIDTHRRFWV